MKRFITVLMSAMIALSMMPTMAFAESEPAAIAEIGENSYSTVQEAINACPENAEEETTIKLLCDVEAGQSFGFPDAMAGSKRNVVLDLDGHTYKFKDPGMGSTGTETQAMHLSNGNTLKIKNGTLAICPESTEIKRLIQNYCELTLEDVTVDASNAPSGFSDYNNSFCRGTVTLKGNTSFKASKINATIFDIDGKYCDDHGYDVKLIIDENFTGSIGEKIEYVESKNGRTSEIEDNSGYLFEKNGYRYGKNVRIGEKYYQNLHFAVRNAEEGETVTILRDITESYYILPAGKSVSIDMNNHNLQFAKQYSFYFDGFPGKLELIGSGDITASRGVFYLAGNTDKEVTDKYEVSIGKNVTVNGPYAIWIASKDSGNNSYNVKVDVYGTVKGPQPIYVSGNIKCQEDNAPIINIHDGATIECTEEAGIYLAGYARTNVGKATITCDRNAISVAAGELSVNGATITGGNVIDSNQGGGGSITFDESSAIFIKQHGTNQPLKITVDDGVLSGAKAINQVTGQSGNDAKPGIVDLRINGGRFISTYEGNEIEKVAVFSADKKDFIKGGSFSSNPKAYVADGTNIYHQKTGNYFVGSMPASTSGYNAWALQDGIYEETYVAPAEPETPDAPVIDNSGSGDNASTNVDASASTVVKDDKAETSINSTTGNKIVENAKENNVSEVVIKAETEKGEATGSTVALPEATVQALAAEDVQASVTIKTDNATVTLDKDAVKATAEQAGTDGEVKLVVETIENTADTLKVELKLVTSKGTVTDFKGGNVTVTVPVNEELAGKKIVCVYIDENGKYTKMEGELSKDRKSYIFKTGHFSTYAILEEAEADAIIAEQNKPSDIASAKVTGVVNKTYTGKSITQNPVVTVGENKIVKGADYTVSYKNNVNAGVATLTIKGVGSYTGAITKTFKINPKGTSISKVTGQKKAVKVVWKKQLTKMKSSYISGYQVQYSTSSKFTSGTSKYANAKFSKGRTTKTIKNLKSGKKYYVRVRTYKSVDGTKCYSSWSKVKSVKTK